MDRQTSPILTYLHTSSTMVSAMCYNHSTPTRMLHLWFLPYYAYAKIIVHQSVSP